MASTQRIITKEAFGKRVDRLLKNRKISRIELGKKLGVKRQTIDNYINGHTSPDVEMLQEIANELNVSVSDLLGKKEDVPDSNASLLMQCNEYTGLSMDAIEVLHFWTTQKRVHAINEKHSYEEGSIFRESKDWVNLLSLLICTDAGGPISNKYDLLLLSSIYEYVTFQPDDNFTLFKANKSEEGYSPEVMGVFKSDDLYMADKHGMRPITTELMKEAMRKYINDNLDKLAEIIQDAKIQRSYPLSSVANIDE